jgi:hypothetical protein
LKTSKVKEPLTYDFDYIYKLKMTHKKRDTIFDYYQKEDAKYSGFDSEEIFKASEDTKVFMIMNAGSEITAMFMQVMGKKVIQKTTLKASDFDAEDGYMSNFTFTESDSKTINGYECDGFVSENDSMKIAYLYY